MAMEWQQRRRCRRRDGEWGRVAARGRGENKESFQMCTATNLILLDPARSQLKKFSDPIRDAKFEGTQHRLLIHAKSSDLHKRS